MYITFLAFSLLLVLWKKKRSIRNQESVFTNILLDFLDIQTAQLQYWIGVRGCIWSRCEKLTCSDRRTGRAASRRGKAVADSQVSVMQRPWGVYEVYDMIHMFLTCAPVSSALCIQDSVSLRLWASSMITTCEKIKIYIFKHFCCYFHGDTKNWLKQIILPVPSAWPPLPSLWLREATSDRATPPTMQTPQTHRLEINAPICSPKN